MDTDWIMSQLKLVWNLASKLSFGQAVVFGLALYLAPHFIRGAINVLTAAVKSVVSMLVWSVLIGILINLWFQDGSDVKEVLRVMWRFVKKSFNKIKPNFEYDWDD